MDEESEGMQEAQRLLIGVADSLKESHPFFKERCQIEATPQKELALMILASKSQFSRLDVAKLSFGLGVYLCQQRKQLNKILEK
jgi:hypothetical protein